MDEFFAASRGYRRLRGYPNEEDGEFMIIVEMSTIGSYDDFAGASGSLNNG